MAFYSTNEIQTIAPGASVVFNLNPVPDDSGNIMHQDGTSSFLLSGGPSRRKTCPCCNKLNCKNYIVNFGANVAVATGETVGPVSVAIEVNGAVVPTSTMIVTPTVVDSYSNISREMPVPIFCGCCQTVTITNTSDMAITMQNAGLEILDGGRR